MVELKGLEPLTSCLQSWCSSHLSYSPLGSALSAAGSAGITAVQNWRSVFTRNRTAFAAIIFFCENNFCLKTEQCDVPLATLPSPTSGVSCESRGV